MISKRAIIFVFLLWFAICYFALQIFFFDTLQLYADVNFFDFLRRGVFSYFGIPTHYLLIILALMAFLGIAAVLSLRARRLILILAPINGLLIAACNYILNSDLCVSRDCIGRGFGAMIWAGFFWMGLSAIIPVAWALRGKITNLFFLILKTVIPGIVTILVFILFWFSSTNPLRTTIIEWRVEGNEAPVVETRQGQQVFPIAYAAPTVTQNDEGGISLAFLLSKISEVASSIFTVFLFRN